MLGLTHKTSGWELWGLKGTVSGWKGQERKGVSSAVVAACHCGTGDTRTVAVLEAVRAVIGAVLAVLAG